MTSNARLLDRAVSPELMGTALRIAQLGKPDREARHLLEIALRDEVESKTGRKKTATILAGSWLRPAHDAQSVVEWARDHLTGDVRLWYLGVLMANYSFFGELCGAIGRRLGLNEPIDTSSLRTEMKARWGDRDVVNVSTRSAIRTLRAFGVLTGDEGDASSERGQRLEVDHRVLPWLIHVLLVGRGEMEIDARDALRAPEFFMFELPSNVGNGYPHLERFTEGGGRVVLRRVVPFDRRLPPLRSRWAWISEVDGWCVRRGGLALRRLTPGGQTLVTAKGAGARFGSGVVNCDLRASRTTAGGVVPSNRGSLRSARFRGSGKSTVAVLRSRYLGDSTLAHSGRVLLVTFARTLTTYLGQLVGSAGPNVDVLTMHEAGRSALTSAGLVGLYNADQMKSLQRRAIGAFRLANPQHRLAPRSDRFFFEEFAWIAGHGIESEADYLGVERVGRASARLLRADRSSLYAVYEDYVTSRTSAGYDYDLQSMPHRLRVALEAGEISMDYRHVVIDEAQDFPPEVMRAAARIVPTDGSVTVFADYAQQIYGRRLSWRSAGLSVERTRELHGNYRNTRQIAAVAAAVAGMPGFEAEELVDPSSPRRDGPLPRLVECDTYEAEDRWVVDEVARLSAHGNVAVLARSLAVRRHFEGLLGDAKTIDRNMGALEDDGVYVGTLHAAKGLEFESVLVVRCSANHIPDPSSIEGLGEEEAIVEDLRLLYVAVTRPRTNLAMTFSGRRSELIPDADGLFDESRMA